MFYLKRKWKSRNNPYFLCIRRRQERSYRLIQLDIYQKISILPYTTIYFNGTIEPKDKSFALLLPHMNI